jgi:hypothetical protein
MPACSRPPLERALDANQVALGERWAEQVFTGDGQGLGVFRLTGCARVSDSRARGRSPSRRCRTRAVRP